jgi:hypothetical protein
MRMDKREDRLKCLPPSTTCVRRHRPSHVVEAVPARVAPRLDHMVSQYLTLETVPTSSASPQRLFSRVGLVKGETMPKKRKLGLVQVSGKRKTSLDAGDHVALTGRGREWQG